MRHDLLAAEHQGAPGDSPAHGVEHGHDAADRVRRGESHDIGHADRHGVQVLGSVLVFDAFGITGGSARVAQSERRVLIDFGPLECEGPVGDEILVIDRIRQCCGPVLVPVLHGDDYFFDAWNATGEFFEQREHVGIGDDQPVAAVIDDELEVVRREAQVQGVQHGTHAGGRVVRLEVARPVPHEGADAVADANAGIAQRMRQLVGALAGLTVGLAARTRCGGGNDLGLGRHVRASIDETRHQEGCALHPHAIRVLYPSERGVASTMIEWDAARSRSSVNGVLSLSRPTSWYTASPGNSAR